MRLKKVEKFSETENLIQTVFKKSRNNKQRNTSSSVSSRSKMRN